MNRFGSAPRAVLWAWLFLAPPLLHAERVFVGVAEADSCESLVYGFAAFGRFADLPKAPELLNGALLSALAVPSLSLVRQTERLQIVQTLDPNAARGDENPVNVAVVPLGVAEAAFNDAYRAAYSARKAVGPFTVYESPADTNLPPRVAVGVWGKYAFTSPSASALQWAWENRQRLIEAPAQTIPGTLRVLVHPPRLADVLDARAEQAAPLLNVDKLIRDFGSLSLSLTVEGQAISVALRGRPLEGSPLAKLSKTLFSPPEPLWCEAPDNAFLTSLSANRRPDYWDPYMGDVRIKALRPASDIIPADAFTGERLLVVIPSPDKHGVCLVHVEPLTNAPPAAAALSRLDGVQVDETIRLTRGASRRFKGTTIETYSFATGKPVEAKGLAKPRDEPSVISTLLNVLLKDAELETAVWNNSLVSVIGATNAFEDVVAGLDAPHSALSLRQRISAQDAALAQGLLSGVQFNSVALIRHLVAIMPGVRPEHLSALPSTGDGASFGIARQEDGTLTASLRIQSNEIAALQRINRDGREVLQELFFQIFASQLLNQQHPGSAPAQSGR